ncbi:MAG: Asp-tRNA(Asn)/Glu-tRNA(Gln) amidotransferase subunit GatC [Candidatus Diapherotrites archaeon]
MGKVVVDEVLVRKVASNARLLVSDEEVKRLVVELNDVLSYFSLIDSLDVSNVEPSFQPYKMKNVFREDVVRNPIHVEVSLSNTKNKKGAYFLGPGVL